MNPRAASLSISLVFQGMDSYICALQILDPSDPTLYDCSGSSPPACLEYNGNGGDLCLKAGASLKQPCCSSVASALQTLCVQPLNQANYQSVCTTLVCVAVSSSD